MTRDKGNVRGEERFAPDTARQPETGLAVADFSEFSSLGKVAELGENIIIRRFTRYLVGEPLDLSTSAQSE